jgi:cytochrome b6-f complex iron-sulfur subunit
MDRKEFLTAIGASGAGILLATCLGSCKKEFQAVVPPDVDFVLDLSLPEAAPLQNNGGYIYKNGVVIARTVSGQLIAVAQACTHLGTSVEYQLNQNRFFCPNHGATFTTTGANISGPTTVPLKQYVVSVNGSIAQVIG